MGIVEDIVDEDAAAEDIEVEAIAEMVNQAVDVAVIEAEATHKQLCSNCISQTQRSLDESGFSFRCTKSFPRFATLGRCGSKTAYLPLIRIIPLLN